MVSKPHVNAIPHVTAITRIVAQVPRIEALNAKSSNQVRRINNKTDHEIHMEWEERSLFGNSYKVAQIKGNRKKIQQEMLASKKIHSQSGYYGQSQPSADEKLVCEFKAVMTNAEIKNCQNQSVQ